MLPFARVIPLREVDAATRNRPRRSLRTSPTLRRQNRQRAKQLPGSGSSLRHARRKVQELEADKPIVANVALVTQIEKPIAPRAERFAQHFHGAAHAAASDCTRAGVLLPSPRQSVTSTSNPRRSQSATKVFSRSRSSGRGSPVRPSTTETSLLDAAQVAHTRIQLNPTFCMSSRSARQQLSSPLRRAVVTAPEQEERGTVPREFGVARAQCRVRARGSAAWPSAGFSNPTQLAAHSNTNAGQELIGFLAIVIATVDGVRAAKDDVSSADGFRRGRLASRWANRDHKSKSYSRTTFSCSMIFSTGTSCPLPLPGQTSQVSFQVSGVRTFDSQKGQVRHCRGRSS